MNRVKELRIARGVSQKELAAAMNVHQTAVSQWETGRTDPDIATAVQLARYFRVSVDHLFGIEAEDEGLSEIYLDLARGAQDRKLRLSKRDIKFLLDLAESLNERDESR